MTRLDLTRLADEQAVLDQLWAALPAAAEHRDLAYVLSFLQHEGLQPEGVEDRRTIYAYADGPPEAGSSIECEWYLEFRFDREGGRLTELAVEKRLIGP